LDLKVCAGIVLYNPEVNLLKKNVEALYPQVEKMVLYNNGSSNFREIKDTFSVYNNVEIIDGKENKGIAFALNQILYWAEKNGYRWVLTMDQDSVCANNMIAEYAKYVNDDQVALISPYVLNNGKTTLSELKAMDLPKVTQIDDPVKCITSACLTNVEVAKKLGSFNEKLFIDCVDIDLNCRVLEAGYKILRVNTTYLIQQMGESKPITLFEKLEKITNKDLFRRAKAVAVYSDLRLYYHSRNSRYIRKTYKNHGNQTTAWFIFLYYVYFSLFYPSDRSRLKMWKAMIKGFCDYKVPMKEKKS
jgi:rhamnosyltransferase